MGLMEKLRADPPLLNAFELLRRQYRHDPGPDHVSNRVLVAWLQRNGVLESVAKILVDLLIDAKLFETKTYTFRTYTPALSDDEQTTEFIDQKLSVERGAWKPLIDDPAVDIKDVGSEFREGGMPDGAVLTALHLRTSLDWDLSSSYLTKNYGPDKTLKRRIKVGRAYAYQFTELAALRRNKTENI